MPSTAEGDGWRPTEWIFQLQLAEVNWSHLSQAQKLINSEFLLTRHHASALINPISPIQLYKIACRAAVFASAHLSHHLISRKDKIPTPSHPMKSWKRLLAVTRINIVM